MTIRTRLSALRAANVDMQNVDEAYENYLKLPSKETEQALLQQLTSAEAALAVRLESEEKDNFIPLSQSTVRRCTC